MKIISIIAIVSLIFFGCYDEPYTFEGDKPVIITSDSIPAPNPDIPIPPVVEPPRPGFVNLSNLEDTILLDLQSLDSDVERRFTRYLVGCDRFNQGEDLTEFEQGVNRGINGLSQSRFLEKVIPVGNANCIYRISLRDYFVLFPITKWRLIERSLKLDFVSDSVRNKNIQFLTNSIKGYVFAVDFMLTSYEADAVSDQDCIVYCRLVDQPRKAAQFWQSLNINRQNEVNDERAFLSGFSQSQISIGKTRLIEVLEANEGFGYVMTSYDTALKNADDIFTNPFTVELANAGGIIQTDKIFKHDANEIIYPLPNGLAGWRLQGADGVAASFAPNDVVIDVNNAAVGLDPTIRLGSCSGCHFNTLMIGFRDQLNTHISSNSAFDQNEKNIGNIFFSYDKITPILGEADRANNFAMAELGIDADTDPFTNVLLKPFRSEMTADQVAAFLFLDTQEFLIRLEGSAVSGQKLGNLLNGGTVSLAVLTDAFVDLVAELNAFSDENL